MPTSHMTAPSFFTLILLCGLSVVSLNLFLPSLPAIAVELEADYALVNLAIAGYAAMTALLQLILGPLSDRYGRRPVMLGGVAVFCLASLGCLLADNIWSFLAFRMLQAVIAGGYSIALAVIRDTTRAEKAASLIGYLAMAWALAPMLGPMLGGALDALFGWRASFLALLGFGLAALVLTWWDLGETNKTPTASLLAQARDYPALLRARRFWGYALCMAFSTGAFYAFLGGAPLVASAVFNMPTASLGVAMGSITGGFIFGSFLAGRLADRHNLAGMMIAGRLTACGGLALGLLLLAFGQLHLVTFFGSCIFVGIGNGLTMPSANAGALSVRPQLAGSAAGLTGALAVAGGAIMSALTGWVMTAIGGTPVALAAALLAMMLLASSFGLAAAIAVLRLDRRHPESRPADSSPVQK